MKIIKILLIVLLVLVTALYCMTALNPRLSGRDSAPVITCDSPVLEVSVTDGTDTYLSGVTASDGQDGDISSNILIQGISKFISGNTARITYIVFDSDGNMASVSRQLCFTDYTPPRFEVLQPLQYVSGASIGLLDRLRVTDAIDGDITGNVRVSALTATAEAEIYSVDLQVTNSMGHTVRVTLPVVVTSGNASRPVVNLTEYLVYLNTGDHFTAGQYLQSATTAGGRDAAGDVVITGTVDTSTPGTYLVYYRCSDSLGTGTAVLTVVVEEGGQA